MAISPAGVRDERVRQLGGDEEDSPWMVSTELHLSIVTALIQGLSRFLATQPGPWHAGGEVFVIYGPAAGDHVAPDVYAAPVEDYPRDTDVVAEEGLFPPLVVEVISSSSWTRDTTEKVVLYDLLGAEEYVLFDPTHEAARRTPAGVVVPPRLWGYRRDGQGAWRPWPVEEDGSLRSAVLGGVRLRPEDRYLRVLTPAGTPVPFTDELDEALATAEEALTTAEQARQAAEQARQREQDARQAAEQEVVRLRDELRRHGLA